MDITKIIKFISFGKLIILAFVFFIFHKSTNT